MRTLFFLVFILCLLLVCFPVSTRDDNHHRLHNEIIRRNAKSNSLESIVNVLVTTSSELKDLFGGGGNDLSDSGDPILDLLDNIPYVGRVIAFIQKGAILRGIAQINSNLKIIEQQIKTIGNKVDQILHVLQLSIFQKQVAEDIREIENCYKSFLLFIQESAGQSERDNLIQCSGAISNVREIGRILNDETVTFLQKPLFTEIIELIGHCDGKKINDVFNYLLGLYSQGCTAIIAAETLKYNGSSNTVHRECTKVIKQSLRHIRLLYDTCKVQSCNKMVKVIEKIVKESDIGQLGNTLHITFPWFHFVVLQFNQQDIANVRFFGGTLNRLILPYTGYVKSIIMWSEYESVPLKAEPNLYEYGVEYTKTSLSSNFDQLNLTLRFLPGSGQIGLIGNFPRIYENKISPQCIRGNNASRSRNDDDDNYIKNYKKTKKYWNTIIEMPIWEFITIIVTIIIVCLSSGCIIRCCKKRYRSKKDDD
ncbi:Hypothetical predicted protein [Mytilus galloprovincialis]|uniref:Uncharacterized protein n=1 Tax=Mytilus galloprovincialis TaxID=29158 RepID=A0A8B6CFQ6_MYTGA|nr:Hypothetical predicted protein [Mytilus galloprovincialis]